MLDGAPGIEEAETVSVAGEVGGLDTEEELDQYLDQADGDGDDEDEEEDTSFRRFIYSDDVKHIQRLATRKALICGIPLEGYMSQTHIEMREAMPN